MNGHMILNDTKINQMGTEKRIRAVNAAMAEFCRGYRLASTDKIAADAAISKGLLFHYFGSKLRLFHYCFWYGIDVIKREFAAAADYTEPDFLNRVLQMTVAKIELSYRHPAVFDFVTKVYFGGEPQLEAVKKDLFTLFDENWQPDSPLFMQGVDMGLFRDDIEARLALSAIRLTLTGFAESIVPPQDTAKALQENKAQILADLEHYAALFRKTFYK